MTQTDTQNVARLTVLETWRGIFLRPKNLPSTRSLPSLKEMLEKRNENIGLLKAFLASNLAELGSRLEGDVEPGDVEINDVAKTYGPLGEPVRYLKLPDVTNIRLNGYSPCTLRIRLNPCIDANLTKVWSYIFMLAPDGRPVADIMKFSKLGEQKCDQAVNLTKNYIEKVVGEVDIAHSVSIFNYGVEDSGITKFLDSETSDGLEEAERSNVKTVCQELVDTARPEGEHNVPEIPPFSISTVSAPEQKYKALYTQVLYDERRRLRIAGVVPGSDFTNVHRPARAFALRLTQSL